MSRAALLAAALALAACAAPPPAPEVSRAELPALDAPAMRLPPGRAVGPPTRPNAEIAQDILDLSFRLESGRAVPRLSRFEGPVTVAVRGPAPPTLRPDLRALVARLGAEAGLPVRLVEAPAAIEVVAVAAAELAGAVPGAACFTVPSTGDWTGARAIRAAAAQDWAALSRRTRATVFVPADAAPQEIRDCLHEEVAQALGPLNDLYRLPDSVFNDDNVHSVLTGFDMLVLRALYAPELASGMTRAEVAARLPPILARLNPDGERAGLGGARDAGPAWTAAIRIALDARAGTGRRIRAAAEATALAAATPGPERGFSLYVLGRLTAATDPKAAGAAFAAARAAFAAHPEMRLHEAHVLVQLAAHALAAGRPERALALVDRAVPIAARHETAALLASLLLVRAEALAALGRDSEAAAARLDSLGWARYGFGPDIAVPARPAKARRSAPHRSAAR